MWTEKWILVITAVALVHCFGPIYGEELEAKIARAKLPNTLTVQQFTMELTASTFLEGK
jgi:hypothetical protein